MISISIIYTLHLQFQGSFSGTFQTSSIFPRLFIDLIYPKNPSGSKRPSSPAFRSWVTWPWPATCGTGPLWRPWRSWLGPRKATCCGRWHHGLPVSAVSAIATPRFFVSFVAESEDLRWRNLGKEELLAELGLLLTTCGSSGSHWIP